MPFAQVRPDGDRRVAGWYGKLPSRGDFVSRGLPRDWVAFCDGWIHAGLAAFREARADTWRERYEAASVWSGILPRSVGPGAVSLLVVGPSRDRVGRHFPLCALVADDGTPDVSELARLAAPLAAVVRAGARDGIEPEALDAQLEQSTGDWLRRRAGPQTVEGVAAHSAPETAAATDPGSGSDILAALGIELDDDVVTVPLAPDAPPWPDLAARFDPRGAVSYWWTVSAGRVPLAFEHYGSLDGNLFCTLFDNGGEGRDA